MDVKLSIGEGHVGTSNPIEEEVKKDEMDTLEEEDIWRSRRERMDNALAAARTAVRREPQDLHAAASRLEDVIEHADVEVFISEIERLAYQTDLSATLNFQGLSMGSLLHIAVETGDEDIVRLLVDYVGDHLITAPNDWGDTPLHVAAKAGRSEAAAILIRRVRDLPNVEVKNQILRMQNKHGNTALHEAVLSCDIRMVKFLLSRDPDLIYLKNAEQKSPLYLALHTNNQDILAALFMCLLEPSKIQGLSPIHGAVLHGQYALLDKIQKKDMKLFAMTDSGGGNVFHLAAFLNKPRVFGLLGLETKYLARDWDTNGNLPIHIASKMGYVHLIEKLHPVSGLLNKQGQTILHVAAKYGQTSAVKYILKHPKLGMSINQRDYDGNTPLHVAAIYSQPTALVTLLLDERIEPSLLNHECLTAYNIALDLFRGSLRTREALVALALHPVTRETTDLLILRPEARDKAFHTVYSRKEKPKSDLWNEAINSRLLVATIVTTVTFAAGFTVPGGFNSSDTASKYDQGMPTMLDKRLFQAFMICNTIAMFSSMITVIALVDGQQRDLDTAATALVYATWPLTIALVAMSTGFLTGVTLIVGKLPWLANTIFCLGILFLLCTSSALLLELAFFIRSHRRPIHRVICRIILYYTYLWRIPRHILDDQEWDRKASRTSATQRPDGAGEFEDC